jgi:CRP-like cAMP-binding protein
LQGVTGGDFLAWLSPTELSALEALGRRRSFPTGQVLFSEADEGREVLVLLEGHVKVTSMASSGREVILDVMDENALLGELSAVDGEARSATAVALTPVSVLVIPIKQFQEFLEGNGHAAMGLLRVIAARLRRSSQRQLEFGTSDALGRLSGCLLTLAERYGTDEGGVRRVTIPVAQHEIAAMTGLSREAVVKGLRALRSLGWIDMKARDLLILDEPSLRTRAAG